MSDTPLTVEVPDVPGQSALLSCLDAAGVRWTASAGSDFVVHPPGRAPVPLRPWREPRGHAEEKPFAERSIRHVLGAVPTLDPHHLLSTVGAVARNSFLPLSTVLDAHGELVTSELGSSDDKTPLLAAIEQFLTRAGCGARVLHSLLTLADELVTNAVYNAPVEGGRRLFASTSRTVRVPCPRPPLVRCGVDDHNIAIAVRDSYGSLTPEEVLDNLHRCQQVGEHRIEEKRGGAGLGLYLLLLNSTRVIFNIEAGTFTEVIVLRRLRESWRAFTTTAPTVNLCARRSGEHRRHRRLPIRWTAEVACDGRTLTADVLDISAQGAFVVPHQGETLPSGARVQLTLFAGLVLEEGAWTFAHPALPLRVEGVARWSGDSRRHNRVGSGVQFEREQPALAAIIDEIGGGGPH